MRCAIPDADADGLDEAMTPVDAEGDVVADVVREQAARTARIASQGAAWRMRRADDFAPGIFLILEAANGGAEGGTRTHTSLHSTVFETVASAIPPLRRGSQS